MTLRFAYNTNGIAHHRLDDALALIADSGYNGVALTLDHQHFDPYAPDLARRAEQLAAQLDRLKLGLVIETGARFLLDPRRLTVAISRPKQKIIVVASQTVFNLIPSDLDEYERGSLWKHLHRDCRQNLLWQGEITDYKVNIFAA